MARSRASRDRDRDEQVRLLKLGERRVEAQVARAIRDAMRRAADRLAETSSEMMAVGAVEGVEAELEGVLMPLWAEMGALFGGRVLDVAQVGHKRINDNPNKPDWFDSWFQSYAEDGGQRIVQISETTRADVRRIIMQTQREGGGTADAARRIRDVSPDLAGTRAYTIARTETHNAAMHAGSHAADNTGRPMLKEWMSAMDGRERASHHATDGTKVESDKIFQVGNSIMAHPGDPRGGAEEIINCRCVLGWEPADEPADAEPAADDWGDVSESEAAYHDEAFAQSPPHLRAGIGRTGRVNKVERKEKRAHHRGQGATSAIDMDGERGTSGPVVWRHEYGHHFDFEHGRGVQPLSAQAGQDMIKDRKALVAHKKRLIEGLQTGKVTQPGPMARRIRSAVKNADDPQAYLRQRYAEYDLDHDEFMRLFSTGHPDDAVILRDGDLIALSPAWKSVDVLIALDSGFYDEAFRVIYRHGDAMGGPYAHLKTSGIMGADHIGAISDEAVGFGHGKDYYKKFGPARDGSKKITGFTMGHTTEAMANVWAIEGADPTTRATVGGLMRYMAPRAYAALLRLIEDAGR